MKPFLDGLGWWERRRLAYNVTLVLAGMLGFMLFVSVEVVCAPLQPGESEITILGTALQAIAYFIFICVANVFCCLGYVVDAVVPARRRDLARSFAFWIGLAFSVALPTVPFLLVLFTCQRRAA